MAAAKKRKKRTCVELPLPKIPTLPAPITIPLPKLPGLSDLELELCCKLPPIPIPVPPIPLPTIVLNPAFILTINNYIKQLNSYVNSLPLKCPLE